MKTQVSPACGWIACSGLQRLCRLASRSVSQLLDFFPVSQPRAFASDHWDRAIGGRATAALRDYPRKVSLDHRLMWLIPGYVVPADASGQTRAYPSAVRERLCSTPDGGDG